MGVRVGVDNGSRLGVDAGVCRGAASAGFSVGAGMGVGGVAGRVAGSSVAVVLEVMSGARVNGVSSTDSAGLVFGVAVAEVSKAGAGVDSTLGSSSGGKNASAVSDGGS